MIGIVDYGLSNLTCVEAAVRRFGFETEIGSRPDMLDRADKIILPGVGAFGDAMRNLRQSGMTEALDRHVRQKRKPFLGICLGAQLICRDSDEHGHHEGLGWIDASVRRIAAEAPLRIPHVGWDDLRMQPHAKSLLFENIPADALFYFTHSHAIYPSSGEVVTAYCEYGQRFAAAVQTDGNIHATQFHPEKSQRYGLALLENFLRQS